MLSSPRHTTHNAPVRKSRFRLRNPFIKNTDIYYNCPYWSNSWLWVSALMLIIIIFLIISLGITASKKKY